MTEKVYNGWNNFKDRSSGPGNHVLKIAQQNTMPLTPTELLQPRVLAIGTKEGTQNYPHSKFHTGQILKLNGQYYENDAGYIILDVYVESAPNCFRPLDWWEMREPEQMPLYVKNGENGKVRKVSRYYHRGELLAVEFEGGRTRNLNKEWVPCDEAEFINQNGKQ